MAVKTHWDSDKPALSFTLAEGGGASGVNGRVERDGATGAAWLMGLAVVVDSDSCLVFTPDSSEGIVNFQFYDKGGTVLKFRGRL